MPPATPHISTDEALRQLLSVISPVGTELRPIGEADGAVLRQSLDARRTQPPCDVSAMDGYAVRAQEAAAGARLGVIAEISAGGAADIELAPNSAIRIFTGAPLPSGADAILLQEDAAREGDSIVVQEAVAPGAAIRPKGGDFHAGETLLPAPRRLSPADISLAAAMGAPWLTVSRPPRVALLALGDELRWPGESLNPQQITSSNNFGVGALMRRGGAAITSPAPIPDDLEALRAAIRAVKSHDLIITLGGASAGDHDLARPALEAEGAEVAFHKIAMRPGKPLMAGRLGDALIVGLPGNPVSAMVCAHLFLRPALDALLGLAPQAAPRRQAPLAARLPANGPREHFVRAKLIETPQGPQISPFDDQDSSKLRVLSAADALAVRPAHDPARKQGDVISYIPLEY